MIKDFLNKLSERRKLNKELRRPVVYLGRNWLGKSDRLTTNDLFTGMFVLGQTGAGKTSGMMTITQAVLKQGWGGMFLVAKAGEDKTYLKWIKEAGREEDVVVIGPNANNFCLELFEEELDASNDTEGTDEDKELKKLSLIDNLCETILEAFSSPGEGAGGKDAFWVENKRKLLNSLLTSIYYLNGKVDIDSLFIWLAGLQDMANNLRTRVVENGVEKVKRMEEDEFYQMVMAEVHEKIFGKNESYRLAVEEMINEIKNKIKEIEDYIPEIQKQFEEKKKEVKSRGITLEDPDKANLVISQLKIQSDEEEKEMQLKIEELKQKLTAEKLSYAKINEKSLSLYLSVKGRSKNEIETILGNETETEKAYSDFKLFRDEKSKSFESNTYLKKAVGRMSMAQLFDEIKKLPNSKNYTNLLVALEDLLKKYTSLADETRSSIEAFLNSAIHNLRREPYRSILFGGLEKKIRLSEAREGKIFVFDGFLAADVNDGVGVAIQKLAKKTYQRALKRNSSIENKPAFLWADECQFFMTEGDAKFQSTARSYRVACFYLTQSITGLAKALCGGAQNVAEAEALTANLTTKLFFLNGDHGTNEWASKSMEMVKKRSLSGATRDWRSEIRNAVGMGGPSAQTQWSEREEYDCPPTAFHDLRSGGEQQKFVVDGIIFDVSKLFTHPGGKKKRWKKLSFNQIKPGKKPLWEYFNGKKSSFVRPA